MTFKTTSECVARLNQIKKEEGKSKQYTINKAIEEYLTKDRSITKWLQKKAPSTLWLT